MDYLVDKFVRQVSHQDGLRNTEVIDSRMIHTFVENNRQYADWFKQRIDEIGAEEGVDFTVNKFVNGRSTQIEYYVTPDMAKEMGMLERNAQGRAIRKWFIARENRLGQIESADEPTMDSGKKSGEIVKFTFPVTSQTVRVVFDENGKPWWVATDVCRELGYVNVQNAIARHCKIDGVSKRNTVDNLGKRQEVTVISEANLYRLMGKSNAPNAEPFQDWLCEDVLPTIRKTGKYDGGFGGQQAKPVDFDQIWKRAGYTMRENAIRAFKLAMRNFKLAEGISYTSLKTDRSDGLPGKSKQTFIMTVGAAKRFMAAAQTPEGFVPSMQQCVTSSW